MHRTSVYFEDDALKALKLLAAASGVSVADTVSEAVDIMLAARLGTIGWRARSMAFSPRPRSGISPTFRPRRLQRSSARHVKPTSSPTHSASGLRYDDLGGVPSPLPVRASCLHAGARPRRLEPLRLPRGGGDFAKPQARARRRRCSDYSCAARLFRPHLRLSSGLL